MSDLLTLYDLFDSFLNGEMTENEKTEFQGKLENEPEFRIEFEAYQDIVIGIKAASEDKWRETFRGMEEKLVDPVIRQTSFYVYRIAAILLVFAIAFVSIVLLRQEKTGNRILSENKADSIAENTMKDNPNTHESQDIIEVTPDNMGDEKLLASAQLYTDYFEGFPNTLVPKSRGAIPADTLILEQAMYFYDLEDYKACEGLLIDLIKKDPQNSDYLFYLAICQMHQRKFEEALVNLNLISISNRTISKEDIAWYKALIYLRTKRMSQAATLFKQLGSYSNKYKGRAIEIIQSLENQQN